jgi:hypothetical protein
MKLSYTVLLRLLIAYEFCWPSELSRILAHMMVGTFYNYLCVQLLHDYTVIVATNVLFVAHK